MTFSLRQAALAAAALSMVALSACGNADPGTSGSPTGGSASPASSSAAPSTEETTNPEASVTPAADLSAVEVTDADVPEVTLPAPWAIAETQVKVLRPGGELKVQDNSTVTINYVGTNGRNGEVFDSSFERGKPSSFELGRVIPGFKKGLAGQAVGSRVLIGVSPEDGYTNGSPDGTILPGDSLTFVVDILSVNFETATGEPVAPAAGLPVVTIGGDGPTIAIPAGTSAPTELVVQPLIKGPGRAITAESAIEVQYRGWTYADGKLFQDAWMPHAGQLSGLIDGWKEGLVGVTSGSRVLLIVPPAKAFPDGLKDANPPLAPGQTLVYVIDILDVQG